VNQIRDGFSYKTQWTIRRYADQAAFEAGAACDLVDQDGNILPAESVIDGNLLLNEGIGELLDLACGLGSPTAFSNANAYIGVGDSTTAESAAHTGLQAASNKTYKAMAATYPQRSGQAVTFRAVFGGTDANYAWQEFSVANGNSDAAKNLNRKVSAQGTKASGQTWTVDMTITLS